MSDGAILVDPYLTDSVAEVYGDNLRRLKPPPVSFADLSDCRVILITHAHLDHCDPASVFGVLEFAPNARIIAPRTARDVLQRAGIDRARLEVARETWMSFFGKARGRAVPAAHPVPVRDTSGEWEAIGYVLTLGKQTFYHAGDTSPDETVKAAVRKLRPTIGFLPVNERNFYRDRAGILGNMSVREAFAFADEVGLQTMVPIHGDLFGPNSTPSEEVELMHKLLRPRVALALAL